MLINALSSVVGSACSLGLLGKTKEDAEADIEVNNRRTLRPNVSFFNYRFTDALFLR